MTASKDDYIIKGVQGEFYPCKPDIFEQTYEIVSGDEFITEVNITELLKVAEASEKQYDQVVKQNRDLQTQLNAYLKALNDVQAIAEKSKKYSSTATKIFERCNEVLCQVNGVQTVSK